mgnify:CR=1 FL=1
MGIEGFTCNLKQYRQQKDMTQEQLANAVASDAKPLCVWKKPSITLL